MCAIVRGGMMTSAMMKNELNLDVMNNKALLHHNYRRRRRGRGRLNVGKINKRLNNHIHATLCTMHHPPSTRLLDSLGQDPSTHPAGRNGHFGTIAARLGSTHPRNHDIGRWNQVAVPPPEMGVLVGALAFVAARTVFVVVWLCNRPRARLGVQGANLAARIAQTSGHLSLALSLSTNVCVRAPFVL
jgi:hypothetical protein